MLIIILWISLLRDKCLNETIDSLLGDQFLYGIAELFTCAMQAPVPSRRPSNSEYAGLSACALMPCGLGRADSTFLSVDVNAQIWTH